MIRSALAALVLAALAPGLAFAQAGVDAARAEGKALGKQLGTAAQSAATTAPDAARVPNFNTAPDQSGYFDDPDAMVRDAAGEASANAGYRAMRESIDRRARFAPVDLDAAIARSEAISADPLLYTSGMSLSGTQGRCVPLPAASVSPGRYKATCNTGHAIESGPAGCTVTLEASVVTVTDYLYYCPKSDPECTPFQIPTCRQVGSHPGPCLQGYRDDNGIFDCTEPGEPIAEYVCSAPVSGQTAVSVTSRQVVSAHKNESQCANLAADANCASPVDTCIDSDPVTRTIDGVEVTQPCWAWRRDYQCSRFTPKQDCDTLESTPGCNLSQEYCITGEEPCRTYERVYDCPLPPEPQSSSQFICDGDVYCIDGRCETIQREANDEFKDAVVALSALDQARRELDPATLTLFKGTRETCLSKVFGIINCCKGKGFPLIPGIQLLIALACSPEEMVLHQRDAQGLCAYVGTYCSSSFLGVCLTKRKVYCCFESKLSRILQEQGRPQLPKPWAKPREETCAGFTVEEFSRLDLSKMDFSEVYAEFTAAARLPDELEAATSIQQKIEDYYARVRT